MAYYYLSILSSVFIFTGYLPELYHVIISKQATLGNIYIWLIWCMASLLSIIYCLLNEEYYVMTTHIVVFTMNGTTFSLKYYYAYIYNVDTVVEKNTIPTIENI